MILLPRPMPATRGSGAQIFNTGRRKRTLIGACVSDQEPLLLRVAKGQEADRTPVWLMRQAGRYMKDFRAFSDKYPFRVRSETPDIAVELSLQPWRAFGTDGVIFFSDILTPLPSIGIEFDVIKGKGPLIESPVRTMEDVQRLCTLDDPTASLPFVGEILSTLREEVTAETALIGFIGTPWTLAAYAMEGKAERHCFNTKKVLMNQPEVLHALLDKLADALAVYASYQIQSGAQIVQLFDSWAHHLSPAQFAEFSLPYAQRVINRVQLDHPGVPLIFHANGGVGKLDLLSKCSCDVLGLDWNTDMAEARAVCPERVLQGNIDPMTLFGSEDVIAAEVTKCINEAGRTRHILNVGHGVVQGTPEENVRHFVNLVRLSGTSSQELVFA